MNTGETDLSTREGLGIFEYVPPSQVGDFKFSATHIKLSNTLGDTL